MAKIQIPEPFLPGFYEIAKLNIEQIGTLSEIIAEIPLGTGPKSFQEIIDSRMSFENIDTDELGTTLFSLGSILSSEEFSTEEISKELSESFNENLEEELQKDELLELENKLITLFSNYENLKLTFKALLLLTENEKSFSEARILSDIRMVFNDNLEDKKRNAVIINQLKIEYRKANQKEELFVSLDTSDLKKLKAQIERALQKEELLKENYKDSISFIEITD
ncbi:hypothetical protein ACSX1A_05745 [Pontibacter sp. MBLB2868]|uniref:hypothetical protein n=1 Tax=Pontibacter sp. MBLB2868 TaxID=3451555 RepID=UPI003F74ED67